jgi:D-amino peptidase
VAVKTGADRYAASLVPPARAREQITEAASLAVKGVERFEPYVVPAPYTLGIEWASTAIAQSCAVIPGMRLAGVRTTEFTTDDYAEIMGLLGVCATIAGEVGCTGAHYG